MKNLVFILVVVLSGYVSLSYNSWFVSKVHAKFRVGVLAEGASDENQEDIALPADFLADATRMLEDVSSLSAEQKTQFMASIPESVDYEFTNQGPYRNIFDFSVFSNRNKSGGIFIVGDSTVAWGFSVDHFAQFAEAEVHALTFGFNVMDDLLLQATDKIIQCFYKSPPTVMVSHSMGSIENPERLRREQDFAIIAIAETKSCEQLYKLVDKNREYEKILQRKKRNADSRNSVQISGSSDQLSRDDSMTAVLALFDFQRYRETIARLEPEMYPLEHVRLHKILEPEKFTELDRSDWSFYRWRPEFRIPFRRDKVYFPWKYLGEDVESENKRLFIRENAGSINAIKSRHREWAERQACFIMPVTLSGESHLRESFLPDESVCHLDFEEILRRDPALTITLQGKQHYAAAGGLIFAALAGNAIRDRELPRWKPIKSITAP